MQIKSYAHEILLLVQNKSECNLNNRLDTREMKEQQDMEADDTCPIGRGHGEKLE